MSQSGVVLPIIFSYQDTLKLLNNLLLIIHSQVHDDLPHASYGPSSALVEGILGNLY